MKQSILLAVACAAVMLSVGQVQASIVGDNIQIKGVFANAGGTATVFDGLVVDPGVEYADSFAPSSGLIETIDVFDGSFRWEFVSPAFNVLFFDLDFITLTGIDWVDFPLTGVMTDVTLAASNIAGVSDIDFSDAPGLNSGEITITFDNFSVTAGEVAFLEFDIVAEHPTTEAIPEPTSLAIFGIGALCMGAGAARRRRKQKQAAA